MAMIIGVHSSYPEHRYGQQETMKLLTKMWPQHEAVLDRLAKTSGVENRNLVLPLERYPTLGSFEERNNIYIEQLTNLLEKTVKGLQEKLSFDWKDLAIITSTTITGIAVPSLDARLMNRLPIPRDVIRNPLFGLGCLGGVAGLNRTRDLLKAHPNKLALLLASEACSLTFQFQDVTMANMVACSLFGDGAVAVLLAGEDHPLARNAQLHIVDGMNSFYPQTERIMGWDVIDTGFKVVLSGNVPDIVDQFVGDDANKFLGRNELEIQKVENIISHPGGPKVLKALAQCLQKDDTYFQHSWQSLKEQANMSSVSVLNVLERSIEAKTLKKGPALALAMDPAFNSEMSLIQVRG